MSAVAAIVGEEGGLRVVVTQRCRIHNHVGKKERIFIVPDLEVEEPVPWDKIPWVVDQARKHVTKSLYPVNHCGECTECCRKLYIKDGNFEKGSGQDCPHCRHGFGCVIYARRPSVCSAFKCRWRKSQELNDKMAPELRPDRCGAIFTEDTQDGDPLIFEVHGDPNEAAWKWIAIMQNAGYKAKKVIYYFGEKK